MEEIKNEYRSLLIELDNTQKEIIALDIDRNQLDHARS